MGESKLCFLPLLSLSCKIFYDYSSSSSGIIRYRLLSMITSSSSTVLAFLFFCIFSQISITLMINVIIVTHKPNTALIREIMAMGESATPSIDPNTPTSGFWDIVSATV